MTHLFNMSIVTMVV
uniref:Uncharacterized protein n=1 Tax=Rhizophora mucronata TaxID=61149 RepID=A0A2P2NC05_RHIMU